MSQKTLITKKKKINDEFYTRYEDVRDEMNFFLKDNPILFNGSKIICPCDTEKSNFTVFFQRHFSDLHLSWLYASSYGGLIHHGKFFYMSRGGKTEKGKLNFNGDLRSIAMATEIRKSDFIITNPPFSLARDFFRIVLSSGKKFIILGNINMLNFKEIIPALTENRIFLTRNQFNRGMIFRTPNSGNIRIPAITWFTNIDFPDLHQGILHMLSSMDENRRKMPEVKNLYAGYDNFRNIIEVPKVSLIPKDYNGMMGVPITFAGKYPPDEFEIIWIIGGNITSFTPPGILSRLGYVPNAMDKGGCPMINGKRIYSRMVIRRKTPGIHI